MRIPESFLDTLRQSSDIVSVMSSYVQVKRTGRDYVCSCPFHSEKTPSCHIYTESQSFYCFGCGAGGDVINFIRLIERLDYVESVRFLAQRAGLSMPEDEIADGGASRRMRLLEMNREAARYFRDVLVSEEGREGLDYLRERGLLPNTIRRYGLGFAPDGWHGLHYFLRAKGYTDDEMLSGALLARRNNSVYDKFRRRVMFPIIDRRGNVIAFGGRTLEKDAPAKYLNSDETLVFQKRENLFSLNFAKNTKEKCLILCEGYMDVIALNQAGFDNAVATLGTAITPQQANLMKRYTNEVVISYDSDEAGQKATVKAMNLLGEVGITARVLKIPDAKDPDEYIKRFGAEQFRTILASAGSAVEFEFAKLKNGLELSSSEGKTEFLKRAVAFLAVLRSDTERMVYTAEAARLTGQQASVLREVVEDRRKKDRFYERRDSERRLIRGTGGGAGGSPASARYSREERAQRGIVSYLFHSPDLLPHIEKKLTEEDFSDEFYRRVYFFGAKRIKSGSPLEISSIGDEFTAEETGKITGICREGDRHPHSLPQLDEYIEELLRQRAKKTEKPPAAMSDAELLAKMEERRLALAQKEKRRQGGG